MIWAARRKGRRALVFVGSFVGGGGGAPASGYGYNYGRNYGGTP